ncbi:MAG: heavy metal translocating P-type ATPase, partial [Methanobacterium sp.]
MNHKKHGEKSKCIVCGQPVEEEQRLHGEHVHAGMLNDLKRRFIISVILTIPILILSSIVYFYGGYPFFKGFYNQIKLRIPGMDTLISVAITSAYLYSSAVVFGLSGEVFFWELATLIDIMLIGHWLEMRSVMGASRALEELVKLMPSSAHKIMDDGSTMDVPLDKLSVGDHVLI